MEYIEVNGTPLPVPAEALAAGPEAVHKWFTEQDAPFADALMKQHGVRRAEVTATGDGGRILSSDVQRALLARSAKAEAEAAVPAPAPATDPAAPKEG